MWNGRQVSFTERTRNCDINKSKRNQLIVCRLFEIFDKSIDKYRINKISSLVRHILK